MLQLALGPKEVQAALSLKTIKRARQLWDEPGFPGFVEDPCFCEVSRERTCDL